MSLHEDANVSLTKCFFKIVLADQFSTIKGEGVCMGIEISDLCTHR